MSILRSILLCLTAVMLMGLTTGQDERLDDPVLEARAQTIMEDLRCLVCQSQSIANSDADLAKDLRILVRERVSAGDTNDEVNAYLVARYGDWVLLEPPVNGATYLLWYAPLALLLAGAVALFRKARQRSREIGDMEDEGDIL